MNTGRQVRASRLPLVIIATAALILAGIGGIAYALEKENHDDFCASCHTQPETDFFLRSLARAVPAPDLAARHARENPTVRCIDCHGGAEPVQRAKTFLLAARDALKFWSGRFHQPAVMAGSLPNANCLDCHRQRVDTPGFDNHFHNRLKDAAAPFVSCVACHPSHALADDGSKFILRRVIFPQCNFCHRQMGKGPSDLR